MVPPPTCCNPFNRKGHSRSKNNLTFISKNYDDKFNALIGFYVCDSCKRQVYRNKNFQFKVVVPEKENKELNLEKTETEDKEDIKLNLSEDDQNFVCKSVDDQCKKRKLVDTLQKIITAPPAKKFQLDLSGADGKILQKSLSGEALKLFGGVDLNPWVNDFKAALANAATKAEKIVLLTTIPVNWSKRKIAKEFGVSRRMITQAKNLHDEQGYGAQPNKKKGMHWLLN